MLIYNLYIFSFSFSPCENLVKKMPPVFLDRLPLPTLQAYTTVSVLLFSSAIYYAIQVTSDPEWNIDLQENKTVSDGLENETESLESIKVMLQNLAINNAITKKLYEMCIIFVEDSLCTWVRDIFYSLVDYL